MTRCYSSWIESSISIIISSSNSSSSNRSSGSSGSSGRSSIQPFHISHRKEALAFNSSPLRNATGHRCYFAKLPAPWFSYIHSLPKYFSYWEIYRIILNVKTASLPREYVSISADQYSLPSFCSQAADEERNFILHRFTCLKHCYRRNRDYFSFYWWINS